MHLFQPTFLLSLLIYFLVPQQVTSQDIPLERLNSFFDSLELHDKSFGRISIYRNGQEVYARSIGFENIENQIPSSEKTIYKIGSITKTFTATLIMMGVEDGLIDLKTPLSNFFPDVVNSHSITIRHLLQHRSGIYNFTNDVTFYDWLETPSTKIQLLNKIKSYKPAFEPNAKTEYSNSNYILLGWIAEQIFQESYKNLLQEKILTPLGIEDFYFNLPSSQIPHHAQSYQFASQWTKSSDTHPSNSLGAGGISGTPKGLCQFMEGLFENKLLDSSSIQQMMSLKDGSGLGLFPYPKSDGPAFGHNGGIDGFQSSAYYHLPTKYSIAYFTNGTAYPLMNIINGSFNILTERYFEIPIFKPEVMLSVDQLKVLEGQYQCENFPLDIKIFIKDGGLFGQATNQPSFPLSAKNDSTFVFDDALIQMTFIPNKKQLEFKQAQSSWTFFRK